MIGLSGRDIICSKFKLIIQYKCIWDTLLIFTYIFLKIKISDYLWYDWKKMCYLDIDKLAWYYPPCHHLDLWWIHPFMQNCRCMQSLLSQLSLILDCMHGSTHPCRKKKETWTIACKVHARQFFFLSFHIDRWLSSSES
jgi:hypothetical protein